MTVLRVHHSISKQSRVRVVIRNQYDEVLLVKNVLGNKSWSFPGGGIERGETDTEAAVRELYEELRVKFDPSRFTHLYTARPQDKGSGVRYVAPIYVIECDKKEINMDRYRKTEIMDMIWTPITDLPKAASLLVVTTVSRLPELANLDKMDASRSSIEQAGYEKYI